MPDNPASDLSPSDMAKDAAARAAEAGPEGAARRLDDWRAHLEAAGVAIEADFRWPNGRRSVYFREPGHVLFEIATDDPGFAVDEPLDALGERLSLPPFLEGRRDQIEAGLKPLD